MRVVAPAATVLVLAAGVTLSSPAGPASGAKPTCDGIPATIVGSAGDDQLTGTAKRDVIVGLTGNDRIEGLGGNDLVCGGPGADRLLGGEGDDQLRGGLDLLSTNAAGRTLTGDVLEGGPGADELTFGYDDRSAVSVERADTVSYAASPVGVVVDLSGETTPGLGHATGEGQDTVVLSRRMAVVGSAYRDRITGSPGRDRLDGRGGNDVIDAGGGPDYVLPDGPDGPTPEPGNDVVTGGDGDDVISSLAGRDELRGGRGRDHIEAFSSEPSVVNAGDGDDYVGQYVAAGDGAGTHGSGGFDMLVLYARALEGQDPPARLVVDLRTGTTTAEGTVTSTGTIGGFEVHRLADDVRWRFLGAALGERVWAIGGGPLRASMGGGNDTVTGTARDDRIAGGDGRDSGDGLGGHDTCTGIETGPC